MKPSTLIFALIVSLSGGVCALAQPGQSNNERAAKSFRLDGGLINSAEGEVRCLRGGTPIKGLGAVQDIESGDAIETGQGRAELLLNPGYYLRLDWNTHAIVADSSPTNLKIEILRGSAIFEIAIDNSAWQGMKDDLFAAVTVVTARDEYTIVRPGAYRFNVAPDGQANISVLKGSLMVDGVPLKAGNTVSASGGVGGVVKLDRGRTDAFDEWSRMRASALVKSNKSLKHTEWDKLMGSGPTLDTSGQGSGEREGDAHTVSARNGEITYSEIGTSLQRANSDWIELRERATLADGDRVRTNAHTRVEIHPYPYVYMFVGGDTELGYQEMPDGQVSITVAKGSIAVFVPDIKWKKSSPSVLRVGDGQREYEIARYGYYRLSVSSANDSELRVYNGSVNTPERILKSPTKLVRHGASFIESGLKREAEDNLDIWSERRHALMESAGDPRPSTGMWFLNGTTNEYTFVPPTHFYRSPYGGDYSVVYQGEMPTRLRRPRDSFGGGR
jgi:hypothetical protein